MGVSRFIPSIPLAHAYATGGPRGYWRWYLDQLEAAPEVQYVAPFLFAMAYSELGDRDRAFQWLERSYRERSGGLTFLEVDAAFDSLRGDPRYDRLVRRIGLKK